VFLGRSENSERHYDTLARMRRDLSRERSVA
jgi:hypothetical protein